MFNVFMKFKLKGTKNKRQIHIFGLVCMKLKSHHTLESAPHPYTGNSCTFLLQIIVTQLPFEQF